MRKFSGWTGSVGRSRARPLEPLADPVRRPEEETVRVIGRPYDLMRADIVSQDGEASLDRLEQDQQLRRKSSLGRVPH